MIDTIEHSTWIGWIDTLECVLCLVLKKVLTNERISKTNANPRVSLQLKTYFNGVLFLTIILDVGGEKKHQIFITGLSKILRQFIRI